MTSATPSRRLATGGRIDRATELTFTVDGTSYRIHYNAIGTGSRVVVMLHGSGPGATVIFPGDARTAHPVANAGECFDFDGQYASFAAEK